MISLTVMMGVGAEDGSEPVRGFLGLGLWFYIMKKVRLFHTKG